MSSYGVYINCSTVPFVQQILSGAKLYETRTKNMLSKLVGKRVYLIESGTNFPVIRCSAKIESAELVPYDDIEKRNSAKITGTAYDIAPGGAKWFYKLTEVEPVPVLFLRPLVRINHGRSWTEW